MRIVEGEPVAIWLGERLGLEMAKPYVAFGLVSREGRLQAGFLYNNYNGCNCDLTAYGPRGFGPRAVKWMLSYPFTQLGALRLTAHTKRSNRIVRRLLPRLGFDYEGTMKGFFGLGRDNDALVFGMMREKCRWIDE